MPALAGIGIPLIIGLVHVALVAPHYHVGSFDDDASYILTAKALLAGRGLTGHLASGQVVVGLYPPGYSALLAPLLWVWPHTYLPLRLLSVASYSALFPLTWRYLGRHGISERTRSAALLVLALGPPMATFASMVMAEAPYLVVLVLLLGAVDAWTAGTRVLGPAGVTVVVLAAAVIWLKQAGLGLVAGLVLWLLVGPLPRRLARSALVAGGVALSLVPVVVARLIAGVPLAGARYSQELGGYYSGGLLGRLVHVLPSSTLHLLSTALPATLVPYLEPLPITGHWATLWKVLSWHVTILVVIGAAAWFRRNRDAAVPMVVVYLAECVLWPFVNERRAILVLPLLVGWYALGAVTAWRWVTARQPVRHTASGLLAGSLAVAIVAVPLAVQVPRDYLYGWNQSGSRFAGSRYVALLSRLGRPSDVVETDYQSSTALYTGHATNWTAFVATASGPCYLPGILADLAGDNAGYLLLGDVNKPGQIDSPCLASQVSTSSWAVPLLHTRRDAASVYELVGPDTAHPGLADLLDGSTPPLLTTSGTESIERWLFPGPETVTQVSVGEVAAVEGPTDTVQVQVEVPDGTWSTVASVPSAVGDGTGRAPFLLYRPARPVAAVAVRVVVTGPQAAAGAAVRDAAVLGPSPATTTKSTG